MGDLHCTLTVKGDETIEISPSDGEKYKTTINGARVTEKTKVNHLDRIVFGHN